MMAYDARRESIMEIFNCTWPYRDAQCPRMFCTALRPTDDLNIAVCESCLERVYRCRDREEADARIARGERAAKDWIDPNEMIWHVVPKSAG